MVLEYNQNSLEKGLHLKNKLGWDFPVMDIVALASMLNKNTK